MLRAQREIPRVWEDWPNWIEETVQIVMDPDLWERMREHKEHWEQRRRPATDWGIFVFGFHKIFKVKIM